MSADPDLKGVQQTVEVTCAVEEAFSLFTERMGEWWPLDVASYGGSRANDIFLEPRVGGRFYERFVDGDELQVGTVTACDPPHLISFTWKAADWDDETAVEVRFTQLPDRTQVKLSHGGFEGLGSLGPGIASKFRGGWPTVLQSFADRAGAGR